MLKINEIKDAVLGSDIKYVYFRYRNEYLDTQGFDKFIHVLEKDKADFLYYTHADGSNLVAQQLSVIGESITIWFAPTKNLHMKLGKIKVDQDEEGKKAMQIVIYHESFKEVSVYFPSNWHNAAIRLAQCFPEDLTEENFRFPEVYSFYDSLPTKDRIRQVHDWFMDSSHHVYINPSDLVQIKNRDNCKIFNLIIIIFKQFVEVKNDQTKVKGIKEKRDSISKTIQQIHTEQKK